MSIIYQPRIYGIKPTNAVSIKWGHSLARGLVWMALPGADHRHELVRGGIATLTTSGTYIGHSRLGLALDSSSTSNGGVYYPWSDKLSEIGSAFSIVVWARIDSKAAFAHLLTIPYSNTWSSPYFAIQFLADNLTNNASLAWSTGGVGGTALGITNGMMSAGGNLTFYGTNAESSAGKARFFKDGVFLEESTRTTGAGAVDFGNKREVILLNHNSADLGEGIDGITPYAAIWNRTLTDNEMMRLYMEPFCFLNYQPVQRNWGSSTGISVKQLAALGVG